MSEFHVSSDGKTLTVLSMKTGYSIERDLTKVPAKVIREAHIKFGISPFKPGWSLEDKNLDSYSPMYQWYLLEKTNEVEERNNEILTQEKEDMIEAALDGQFQEYMNMYRVSSEI